MSALEKIINEMNEFREYPDDEHIWGKPSIDLTFGDFRKAAAELAALRAKVERGERIEKALQNLMDIGKRDLSNEKYNGYFTALENALKGGE